MDTPLYGERTKATKAALWSGIGVVTGFVIAAAVVGVVMGVRDSRPAHFLFVAVLALAYASTALLYVWYEKDGIHPKFKVLVALLAAVSLLAGVALIVTCYTTRPPAPAPVVTCYGLYDLNHTVCYPVPAGNLPDCGLPGFCMFFLGGSACCGNCTLGAANCPNTPPHSG